MFIECSNGLIVNTDFIESVKLALDDNYDPKYLIRMRMTGWLNDHDRSMYEYYVYDGSNNVEEIKDSFSRLKTLLSVCSEFCH